MEEQRKQELLADKDLALIAKRISEIKNPYYTLLIFGSYAKKEQTKDSDIDICMITDDDNKDIQDIISTLSLPIHLISFTAKEFLSMIMSKQNNVGNEIIMNNVLLHGIEGFYELASHAETTYR